MGALLSMKIGTRLGFGFAAILLALVGMSFLAVTQLSSMAGRVEAISEFGLGQQVSLHGVTNAIGNRGVAARNLVLDTDALRNNEQVAVIKQMSAEVEKGLKALDASLAKDNASSAAEMRKILLELRNVEGRYVPITIRIAEAVLAGKRAEATEMLLKECQPTLTEVLALSGKLGKAVEHAASERVAVATGAYEQSRFLVVVLAVVVVGIGIGFAMLLTRSITQPIDKAVHIARTVAAGDLSSRIEVHQNDETGQLLQALKAMNENLSRVVSEVRSSSDAIAIGTGQIASGNADLSSRTETQASNLEQTAASMEELNATVRNNADTASQAAQLASSASSAARRGGDSVGQVVATMEAISTSSRKVVEIISVIDGIAFQTNILALNAAVEAARAGEQGRGFAVVAGEVRVLAQRSAAAAKEIKQLIASSADRVEEGSRLVAEAGSAMEDILTQVQRVNDLIDGINAATTEQTAGIGQVNAAVAQLDQVTQQNAALVEQSAAAADSLRQQARQLVDTVGVFRTSGEGAFSAPAKSSRVSSVSASATGSSAASTTASTSTSAHSAAPSPAPTPAPAARATRVAKAASSTPAAPRAQAKPAAQTAGDAGGDWDTF